MMEEGPTLTKRIREFMANQYTPLTAEEIRVATRPLRNFRQVLKSLVHQGYLEKVPPDLYRRKKQ